MMIFYTTGFHEAVGDTIALSVSTPQHLQKVGLLQNYADTQEDNINALMQIALQKVRALRQIHVLAVYIGNAVLISVRTLYAIRLLQQMSERRMKDHAIHRVLTTVYYHNYDSSGYYLSSCLLFKNILFQRLDSASVFR
jgi:hypothetical protein